MKSIFIAILLLVQISFGQSTRPFFSHSDKLDLSSASNFKEIEFTTSSGKKSVAAAAALSLLLPGLGEWYADDYATGKYFSIAEGTLWLTWTSFRMYGDWVRDDARDFAVQYAGINKEGKDAQYFIDIGNFQSVDDYNEQMLLQRDADEIYNPNSDYKWNWDTDERREQYRQLRVQSDEIYNNANFVIAAVVVNHVVSAINAARTAVGYNDALDQTGSLKFQARPLGTLSRPNGIMFSASYQF
jgi:TM2 domain-containing membrane protein YozV